MAENNTLPEVPNDGIEHVQANNSGYNPYVVQAITRMDMMAEIILGNLLRKDPSDEIERLTHSRAANDDHFSQATEG